MHGVLVATEKCVCRRRRYFTGVEAENSVEKYRQHCTSNCKERFNTKLRNFFSFLRSFFASWDGFPLYPGFYTNDVVDYLDQLETYAVKKVVLFAFIYSTVY